MSTFTFKGISSDDLGLIITTPMIRPTWAPETDFTPIPGRARQNPHTKEWYPNSELTAYAVITEAGAAELHSIYAALKGYGVLSISTAPTEILYAYAHLPVPEAKALLMAELPIVFECEPFAYAVEDTEVDITSGNPYTRIDYGGTVYADPQITFTPSQASTEISCNGKSIQVKTPTEIINAGYPSNYSVTLDCEGQLAYYTRPGGDKIACTELTKGPFPRLHVNDNYIGHTGMQSGILTYRARWY